MYEPIANKIGSTTLKESITTDSLNTPSTSNAEDEDIVYAPGKYGDASMPDQVKRPNPLKKMIMMMMMMIMIINLEFYFINI